MHPDFDDVAEICAPLVASTSGVSEQPYRENDPLFGYVYLARMGKYFKIGRTSSVGRRAYELSIKLPEKLTLIHSITTDDPSGIEAYWHNRFADRRSNGEWFALSPADVKAFKRRTFM